MSLAGSKGGTYSQASDQKGNTIDIVRLWQAIGGRWLSGEELFGYFQQHARPIQLEVGIGNTCGLACQHCFLGYEGGSDALPEAITPLPKLIEATTTLVTELGTRMICVTDRDALTPNRSVPFFTALAELRTEFSDLRFGGVTNGLFIHQYIEPLRETPLDYLDISLEGTQTEHDKIRGSGTYERTLDNLRLAISKGLADRVIVATTLSRLNDDAIIRMIHQLILEDGVEWFDIGPLMAVKMQSYQLHERDLVDFLDSLAKSLEPLILLHQVTIFIELCAYCAAFIPALVDHGWLKPKEIRQDQYGHLYQEVMINSKIKIVLRPELIPEYWRHTLRISADGYVVGGCEPLTQVDYSDLAIGNIQTEPIDALYRKAISSLSPFHLSMQAYDQSDCRSKPCFKHCLGGDPLLAKAVYGEYSHKDPNCIWNEFEYGSRAKSVAQQNTPTTIVFKGEDKVERSKLLGIQTALVQSP
jgi:MoaA/NifB/PqqE/SkfB family radical SAM enzyme